MPRTPDEPTPQQVLDYLEVCEPYTVSDIKDEFNESSRWTIQRRLDSLVDSNKISKKRHSENRVTYWIKQENKDNTSQEH